MHATSKNNDFGSRHFALSDPIRSFLNANDLNDVLNNLSKAHSIKHKPKGCCMGVFAVVCRTSAIVYLVRLLLFWPNIKLRRCLPLPPYLVQWI